VKNAANPLEADSSDSASIPELRLNLIATLCGNGTCPTVYQTNRDTLIVQGYVVSPEQAGIHVPEGELLVEIPTELFGTAARSDRLSD